ncbi:hypothetical protein V8C86DRAFT_2628799 [Haematococcus lacustris]
MTCVHHRSASGSMLLLLSQCLAVKGHAPSPGLTPSPSRSSSRAAAQPLSPLNWGRTQPWPAPHSSSGAGC